MSVGQLSKELQEVAVKEINEDPKRIPSDLAYIKEWLSKQPHINARPDDRLLLTFLRGCKFSLERTKEKIDMYYTLRTVTPEIFGNRDPLAPEIQQILSVGTVTPLPRLPAVAGPRYSLMRHGLADKHKLDQAAVFKVGTMVQDILMLEDENYAVAGITVVQDMADISMGYALSLSPTLVKKAMTCFQKAYPQRVKGVHFFNTSPIFETLNSLVRPFLSDKVKSRMRIHSSIDELYQNISREVLPEEYGGEGGKMADIVAHWKAKVESYRDWFLEEAQYKTDESKRPGKPKTSESVFGLDGSFRQLAVD